MLSFLLLLVAAVVNTSYLAYPSFHQLIPEEGTSSITSMSTFVSYSTYVLGTITSISTSSTFCSFKNDQCVTRSVTEALPISVYTTAQVFSTKYAHVITNSYPTVRNQVLPPYKVLNLDLGEFALIIVFEFSIVGGVLVSIIRSRAKPKASTPIRRPKLPADTSGRMTQIDSANTPSPIHAGANSHIQTPEKKRGTIFLILTRTAQDELTYLRFSTDSVCKKLEEKAWLRHSERDGKETYSILTPDISMIVTDKDRNGREHGNGSLTVTAVNSTNPKDLWSWERQVAESIELNGVQWRIIESWNSSRYIRGNQNLLKQLLASAAGQVLDGDKEEKRLVQSLANGLKVQNEFEYDKGKIEYAFRTLGMENGLYLLMIRECNTRLDQEYILIFSSSDTEHVEGIRGFVVRSDQRDWGILAYVKLDPDKGINGLPKSGTLRLDVSPHLKPIRVQSSVIKNLPETVFNYGTERLIEALLIRDLPRPAGPGQFDLLQNELRNDAAQIEAVGRAVSRQPFLLLRGPPGTGKTSVIAEIALQLAARKNRVLVASQTNVAIDHLVERLDKLNDKIVSKLGFAPGVIRVHGQSEYTLNPSIERYGFDSDSFSHRKQTEIKSVLDRAALSLEKERTLSITLSLCLTALHETLPLVEAKVSLSIDLETLRSVLERLDSERKKKTEDIESAKESLSLLEQELSDLRFERENKRNQLRRIQTSWFLVREFKTRVVQWRIGKIEGKLAQLESERMTEVSQLISLEECREFSAIISTLVSNKIVENQSRLDGLERKIAERRGVIASRIGDQHEVLAEFDAALRNQSTSYFDKELEKRRRRIELLSDWRSVLECPPFDLTRDIVLGGISIFGATCIGAKEGFLDGLQFDYAIIDETSKATVSETLVPISKAERFMLVGDQEQLEPYADAEVVERLRQKSLDVELITGSLFNHLVNALGKTPLSSNYILFLNTQHRMDPAISKIVSEVFYKGELKDAPEIRQAKSSLHLFPTGAVWYDLPRGKETRGDNHTRMNVAEANKVKEIVDSLYARGIEPKDLSIITMYKGQKDIVKELVGEKYSGIMIDTVDSFQGQEREVIILSIVSSRNPSQFVNKRNRVNVALSRARKQLVIVGNKAALVDKNNDVEGKQMWQKIYELIEKAGGVILST